MNKSGYQLILASASPRRRELLSQIGMEFEVMPSGVEEETQSKVPYEMVMELSERKAKDVFDRLSEEKRSMAIVAGADTVVAVENKILGKPQNKREAQEMLSLLQGRTHQVYTGVTLIWKKCENRADGEGICRTSFYERTDVTMYPMSQEEICAYVESGEPMDKAGAYGIQGKCAAYVREIRGDFYNVVGLPVARLYQEIKRMKGFSGKACDIREKCEEEMKIF